MLRNVFLIKALLMNGCSSFNKYRNMQKPIAKHDSVEVKTIDTKGAQMLFNVEVENPNDFALKVDSVKYEVEIGGKKMSTETIDKPSEVAGKSKTVVQLPLTLQFADIFTSIGSFLKNEKTNYRLKGSARVGVFSLPFDESGEFKLTEGKIQHSKN